MVPNKILKERARRQLDGGIFKPTWLKLLGALIILTLIEVAVGSIGFGIAVLLLIGPCAYATERICAKCAKNKEVDYNSLFVGFSENFTQTFLFALISELFIFLWTLLLIVPGIIKSYSYGMGYFIQQEQDNKNWKFCLEKSKSLMNGKKGQLFALDLSFIGWYFLGLLAFGVGIFFVLPYHQMARTNFFLEVYYSQEVEQPQENQIEITETESQSDDLFE